MAGDNDVVGTGAKLRKSLEAKSKEATAISAEIERVQLEAQLMRMRLLAQGVKDESTIPANLRAGGSPEDPGLKFLEQRRLLEWFAEVCDLTSRRTCNVVGDLYVAGYKAVIGHGVQWPLSVPDGLCLTIPIELESSIVGLLSKARRSLLSLDDFECFATEWDMLSVEMCVEGDTMPGLFLVRREDSTAIVVSAWPKLPPPTGSSSSSHSLDAAKFFDGMSDMKPDTAKAVFFGSDGLANTLSFSRSRMVCWEREGSGSHQMGELGIDFHVCDPPEYEHFSLTGPFGRVTIADPPPGAAQREIVEEIVSLSLEHGLRVHHALSSSSAAPKDAATSSVAAILSEDHLHGDANQVAAGPLLAAAVPELPQPPAVAIYEGDSVEVQYQGKWFSGKLQGIQGNFALVSCDVDDPDIITVAPLRKVRAASYDESEGDHGMNKSVSQ
jgi:hypothetical protein